MLLDYFHRFFVFGKQFWIHIRPQDGTPLQKITHRTNDASIKILYPSDSLFWEIQAEKIYFLTRMSSLWIYLISCVHLSGQPNFLHGKNWNNGHYAQTFQPLLLLLLFIVKYLPFL